MTTIPLTILDNFLHNPDAVKDWALSLNYINTPNAPGKRTECLSKIHPKFYKYVNYKVLNLFFEHPVNPLKFNSSLNFQLIENLEGKGWVHQDNSLFTFIIYLHESNPEIDCGTSIWNLKSNLISNINSPQDESNERQKHLHYNNQPFDKKAYFSHHKNFKKDISIPDKYNRLVVFSGDQFHSANYFNNKISPRLTLIGFVYNVNNAYLPTIRSNQTNLRGDI